MVNFRLKNIFIYYAFNRPKCDLNNNAIYTNYRCHFHSLNRQIGRRCRFSAK